jgi:hypothetical protein
MEINGSGHTGGAISRIGRGRIIFTSPRSTATDETGKPLFHYAEISKFDATFAATHRMRATLKVYEWRLAVFTDLSTIDAGVE